MSFLLRSTAFTLRPLARSYATEAAATPSKGLILNFALPHQAIYKAAPVHQVNLSATSGDMGILANHVPVIEELKPGIVEVIETSNKKTKYFVSGGFAFMNPDSSLNINAVEAFPLDNFSLEAVRQNLSEANRQMGAAKDEKTKASFKAEVEVYTALESALSKSS
ncbi:epsilon subunit of F1F0-ATP synthase N-terminal domain-containing protein [Paraphysoderma sedebokerense]|nr:epsilon subunit of F1F0-ATP synthase N-terminal domain-containing protein [Paraphysoderma sedebokerense]